MKVVAEAMMIASAVRTANRLRVFEALKESRDAHDLGRRCGLVDERATRGLLGALEALGLVHRGPDGWEPTFDPAVTRTLAGLEDKLVTGLSSGHTSTTPSDTRAGAGSFYPAVIEAVGTLVREAAIDAAEVLHTAGNHVLEVGGGAAPWGQAYVRRRPGAHVTVVDLPDVLVQTRRCVNQAGLGASFSFMPGDMFAIPLPTDRFDLALVANVCHLFGPERNEALLRRVAAAVRPGGLVAVVDVLPADTETAVEACYHLDLIGRTGAGRIYARERVLALMAAAGLADLRVSELRDGRTLVAGSQNGHRS